MDIRRCACAALGPKIDAEIKMYQVTRIRPSLVQAMSHFPVWLLFFGVAGRGGEGELLWGSGGPGGLTFCTCRAYPVMCDTANYCELFNMLTGAGKGSS